MSSSARVSLSMRQGKLEQINPADLNSIRLPRGVIGRVDEMLKVKGVKLYPKELGAILASIPGLDAQQYQLVVSRTASGTDSLEGPIVTDSRSSSTRY